MANIDILRTPHSKERSFWIAGDEKSQWKKLRKELGEDWPYYHVKDIVYSHNDYGYRANNFDSYEWSKCVAFLGCSHVYGKGNKLEDTIPAIYSELSGYKAINMGMNGGGVETIHHNTHALIEKNYIPKKVIILWPSISRTMFYTGKDIGSVNPPKLVGVWSNGYEQEQLTAHIQHPENYITKAYLIQKSILSTWRANNVEVHSFQLGTTRLQKNEFKLECIELPECVDRARDNAHYGMKTNRIYAEYIHKYSS